METTTRKRANVKRGGSWITKQRRLAIYMRDGFTCAYCGTDLRNYPAAAVTLDHLHCRVNGGNHDATNLVTACHACNSSRQDKPLEDFAPGGALARIAHLTSQPLNVDLAKAIIAGTAGDPRVENR